MSAERKNKKKKEKKQKRRKERKKRDSRNVSSSSRGSLSSPRSSTAKTFPYARRRAGCATRGARRRFDVVPRESALSSGHTGRARDRAMTRTIARAVGGGGGREGEDEGRRKRRKEEEEEEEDEQRAKFVKEDRVRFHLACMHAHVRSRGEEKGGAERSER